MLSDYLYIKATECKLGIILRFVISLSSIVMAWYLWSWLHITHGHLEDAQFSDECENIASDRYVITSFVRFQPYIAHWDLECVQSSGERGNIASDRFVIT